MIFLPKGPTCTLRSLIIRERKIDEPGAKMAYSEQIDYFRPQKETVNLSNRQPFFHG